MAVEEEQGVGSKPSQTERTADENAAVPADDDWKRALANDVDEIVRKGLRVLANGLRITDVDDAFVVRRVGWRLDAPYRARFEQVMQPGAAQRLRHAANAGLSSRSRRL